MLDLLRSAAAFIVVLGVLVFVHEFGHYIAARWRGVHVEVFSIGFGPAIVTWRDRVGTIWKLAWLPLGGYVKLHGQERPSPPEPVEPRDPGRLARLFGARADRDAASAPAAPPPEIMRMPGKVF